MLYNVIAGLTRNPMRNNRALPLFCGLGITGGFPRQARDDGFGWFVYSLRAHNMRPTIYRL